MRPKFIAAVLLLNLVAWANSTAFCLSGLSAMASHVAAAAGITAPQQHACCPHAAPKPAATSTWPTWTQSQSSDNGHRCCFVQNPQIPSNLPGRAQNSNQRGPAATLPKMPGMATTFLAAIATSPIDGFGRNSGFSTVLRI